MSNEVKYLIVGDVNAQGSILFDSISAVGVPTPPAGKFALFNDRSNGNKLSSKDSGGIVTVVGSGGGGGSFNLPVMFIIPSVIEAIPALHFAIEFHETDDYSEAAVYSIDTAVSQTGNQSLMDTGVGLHSLRWRRNNLLRQSRSRLNITKLWAEYQRTYDTTLSEERGFC